MLMRVLTIPFSVMSYILGMTSVKFKDFFIGSHVVTLHVAFLLYMGTQITSLDFDPDSNLNEKGKKPPKSKAETAMFFFQIFLAFAVIIYISRVAKKEIDKKLAEMEEKEGRAASEAPGGSVAKNEIADERSAVVPSKNHVKLV